MHASSPSLPLPYHLLVYVSLPVIDILTSKSFSYMLPYDMRRMGSLNYFHCTQVVDCPSLHLTSELFLCMSSSLTIGPTHKLIHIYLPPPVSPFFLYMYLHPPYIYIPQVLYMRRTDLGSRDTDLTYPTQCADRSIPKESSFLSPTHSFSTLFLHSFHCNSCLQVST